MKLHKKLNAIAAARNRADGNGLAKPAGNSSVSVRGRVPRWGIALLVVVLTAAGTFALFEYVLVSKVPPELVGRWRVVGGQMDGFVMEFTRQGAMTGRKTATDEEPIIEGRARVSGKTLSTTTLNPYTGKEDTGTQAIVSLTATEFVTEDAKGMRISMQRLP
jgi:uncharacterized protein (TIGR03066 family)